MPPEMRRALTERRDLIEARAATLLDTALGDDAPWATELGTEPTDAKQAATWRRLAVVVAAYRDRYGITGPGALGTPSGDEAQKIDAARAHAALDRARSLARSDDNRHESSRTSAPSRAIPPL